MYIIIIFMYIQVDACRSMPLDCSTMCGPPCQPEYSARQLDIAHMHGGKF